MPSDEDIRNQQDFHATNDRTLQIFLCYAHEDVSRVHELYERLRNNGFAPWFDKQDLLPGQDWKSKITEVVKNSDLFLACLSQHSVNKTGYLNKEIVTALDVADEQPEGTLFIIPIRLEECGVPDRLSQWHWCDLYEEQGYEKLLQSLTERAQQIGAKTPHSKHHPQKRSSSSSPHQLRAPVGDFVGREQEIAALTTALTNAGSNAAVICGIRGMGGIGKTELAYKVADEVKDTFPDGLIVVDMFGISANPRTRKSALQHVIRSFKEDQQVQLPDDLPSLIPLYRSYLNGKRVLVIADDARDKKQVRDLKPPIGCALLITSRQKFLLDGMNHTHACNLDTLPPDDAAALLCDICPRIGEHAPALATLCDYLPLALRVSGDLLANHDRAVPRYLEQLEQERLKYLSDPDNPDDPTASVRASLNLSYISLPTEAQQTLQWLGVFVGSFDLSAMEKVLQHIDSLEDYATLLCRRSLLKYDTEKDRYSLHDLVQEFALDRLKKNENPTAEHAARLSHARHYVQVAVKAEKAFKRNTTDGLMFFDKESTNVHAAWRWVREQPMTEEIAYFLIRYIDKIPYIAELRSASPGEHITTIDAAIKAAQFLQDRKPESIALARKGRALYRQGEIDEALEWLKQALDKAEKIGYNRGIGLACANLGSVCYRIDQSAEGLKKVIDWYERAIKIKEYTQDERSLAETQNNLGLTYCDVGNFERARKLHNKALHIARGLQDRLLECKVLNGFGIIEYAAENLDEAISYQEQARRLAKNIDPREEGHAVRWLGEIYKAKGDYKQAQPYYEEALVIRKQINDKRLIEEVELCLQHVRAQADVSNE